MGMGNIIASFSAVLILLGLISIIIPLKKLNIEDRRQGCSILIVGVVIFLVGAAIGGHELQEEEDIRAAKEGGYSTVQEYLVVKEAKEKREDDEKKRQEKIEQARIAAAKVIHVDMRDLLSAYRDNEIGADNKYKGETVEVTGIVEEIAKGLFDHLYVILHYRSGSFERPRFKAIFPYGMDAQLGQLKKRQRLRVVCRISGGGSLVVGQSCKIK